MPNAHVARLLWSLLTTVAMADGHCVVVQHGDSPNRALDESRVTEKALPIEQARCCRAWSWQRTVEVAKARGYQLLLEGYARARGINLPHRQHIGAADQQSAARNAAVRPAPLLRSKRASLRQRQTQARKQADARAHAVDEQLEISMEVVIPAYVWVLVRPAILSELLRFDKARRAERRQRQPAPAQDAVVRDDRTRRCGDHIDLWNSAGARLGQEGTRGGAGEPGAPQSQCDPRSAAAASHRAETVFPYPDRPAGSLSAGHGSTTSTRAASEQHRRTHRMTSLARAQQGDRIRPHQRGP